MENIKKHLNHSYLDFDFLEHSLPVYLPYLVLNFFGIFFGTTGQYF